MKTACPAGPNILPCSAVVEWFSFVMWFWCYYPHTSRGWAVSCMRYFFGEIIIHVFLLLRTMTKCSKVYHPRKPHSPYFPPLRQYLGRQPPLLTGQVEAWLHIPGDSLAVNTDNKYFACLSSYMFYSMKYLTHYIMWKQIRVEHVLCIGPCFCGNIVKHCSLSKKAPPV